MRVALVHELLTMKGGAERVLKILTEMFPDAPIYTLLYDEKKLGDWFPKEHVRTPHYSSTCLPAYLPTSLKYNHHLYLPWFPQAVESWPFETPSPLHARSSGSPAGRSLGEGWKTAALRLSNRSYGGKGTPPVRGHAFGSETQARREPLMAEWQGDTGFDLVISSSSAFVHGIITNGKPKHLCYVNSPARYLWDRYHDILKQESKGILGPFKRFFISNLFHRLRIWDAEVADRPDMLLAASKEVERRIELYWRRESTVVYPPIDDFWFDGCHGEKIFSQGDMSYFLIVSTLVPYKRIEIAIAACNQLKLPLKIVGEGPHRKTLQRLAGPTIQFFGYTDDKELKHLYTNAIATILPGEEDFGLVPLESFACGTPVIAYHKGGALETIVEGKTGLFFDEIHPLENILHSFDPTRFDPKTCRTHAQSFSRRRFEDSIRKAIDALK